MPSKGIPKETGPAEAGQSSKPPSHVTVYETGNTIDPDEKQKSRPPSAWSAKGSLASTNRKSSKASAKDFEGPPISSKNPFPKLFHFYQKEPFPINFKLSEHHRFWPAFKVKVDSDTWYKGDPRRGKYGYPKPELKLEVSGKADPGTRNVVDGAASETDASSYADKESGNLKPIQICEFTPDEQVVTEEETRAKTQEEGQEETPRETHEKTKEKTQEKTEKETRKSRKEPKEKKRKPGKYCRKDISLYRTEGKKKSVE